MVFSGPDRARLRAFFTDLLNEACLRTDRTLFRWK
jgi:hypothetical protein